MANNFYLPVGFKHNGKDILELPIAETGGDAEKIYTKKPSTLKLHTWFAQVISVSVKSIAGDSIASDFIKQEDKTNIPEAVRKIPFVDAGTLLIQIQRECWEAVIKNQKVTCSHCGSVLDADIDLHKIHIPTPKDEEREEKPIEDLVVKLPKTYEIDSKIEQLVEYDGYKFNRIKFRVATLGDAIKHEQIARDELQFWRNIAFDTMLSLYYEDKSGKIIEVPDGYIAKRGKQLFTKDFNTPTLKEIRGGLQKGLPSAKFYYEEECPVCDTPTPFFASVTNFFSA